MGGLPKGAGQAGKRGSTVFSVLDPISAAAWGALRKRVRFTGGRREGWVDDTVSLPWGLHENGEAMLGP